MSVDKIRKIIIDYTKSQKLEILSNTSTVSWLYPGQFTYCLNEEFIWDRYGTFIDCPEEVHFQKIQPVIRWNDFEDYFYKGEEKIKTHLGLFDMTTINGGHIIPKSKHKIYSEMIFNGLIDFLVNIIGLDKEKFVISYFPGGKLSELGKNKKGVNKYDFDFDFPPDNESLEFFSKLGIKKEQMKPDLSRDSFLIPNWICGEVAPWGYRNEILYKTENGLLDIATIEILSYRPIVKDGKIIRIEEWDKRFIINGTGLERLSMLVDGLKNIYKVDNIKPLRIFLSKAGYNNGDLKIESLRIFHRLITDTDGNIFDTRSKKTPKERKKKFNIFIRSLIDIKNEDLQKLFEINAKINSWYPEMKQSITRAIEVIDEYRLRTVKNN